MIAVLAVLAAALVVGWRRSARHRPRTGPSRPGRRRALVVVTTLVAGLVLVALPAAAQTLGECKTPPDPDRPGTGLVGSLDPAPIGTGAPGSVYDEVGYAGQVWWTYDLGCGPGAARDPAASTDTWLGNQVFDVAKIIVGGVNWAHYLIARGSGLLAPLDNVIQAGTRAMYEAVFTTWAGVALAVLAAILLLLAMRGDLSRQAQRASVAVIALAIAAAAYAAPVQWSKALDGVLLDSVTAMQQGFLRQIGVGDQNTLPTVLTDTVVYGNWLRGEFGSADVPQAQQLGRDLLRAQTFTKQEVAARQDGQPQADAKKQQFSGVADRVGDRYSYFQGRSGSRTGAGVLALVQASCIALFQLMSKILILVSMLVIRLLVMVAPALAVLALLKPEVLPAMLRVGGAALVNTLLVGALAGLHSLLVIALFRPGSGVDTWLALLVTGVVTVILWAVARPFRRLASMVTLTRDQLGGVLPGAGTGAMSRAFGRLRGADRQDAWWTQREQARSGAPMRPEESTATATATAGPVAPARDALRVDSEVVRDGRAAEALPAARAALPAGGRTAPTASADRVLTSTRGGDPGAPRRAARAHQAAEADRTLYRRVADGAPTAGVTGPTRPVQAEIVDGAPVYRIYRSSATSRRGGPGADPD